MPNWMHIKVIFLLIGISVQLMWLLRLLWDAVGPVLMKLMALRRVMMLVRILLVGTMLQLMMWWVALIGGYVLWWLLGCAPKQPTILVVLVLHGAEQVMHTVRHPRLITHAASSPSGVVVI